MFGFFYTEKRRRRFFRIVFEPLFRRCAPRGAGCSVLSPRWLHQDYGWKRARGAARIPQSATRSRRPAANWIPAVCVGECRGWIINPPDMFFRPSAYNGYCNTEAHAKGLFQGTISKDFGYLIWVYVAYIGR